MKVQSRISIQGSSTIEPMPTPVPTAVKPTFKVQRGDIAIRTDIGGRIAPANSKPVRFVMDGDVGNVYVEVGDYVEEGQLLADLKVLKELEQEWATVSTQANYEETISTNTLKRAEIKLQLAQLALIGRGARIVGQARDRSPAERRTCRGKHGRSSPEPSMSSRSRVGGSIAR